MGFFIFGWISDYFTSAPTVSTLVESALTSTAVESTSKQVNQFLHKSKTEKQMKKVIVSLFVIASMASCNGGTTTETVAQDSTVVDIEIIRNGQIRELSDYCPYLFFELPQLLYTV